MVPSGFLHGSFLPEFWERRFTPGHSQTALDSCMAAIFGNQFKKSESWDFLGDPVVTISLSKAEGVGLVPDGRAKILHALWPKKKNNLK